MCAIVVFFLADSCSTDSFSTDTSPAIIVFSNGKVEDRDHGADSYYRSAVPGTKLLKTCDHGTILIEVPFDQSKTIEYGFR